MYRRLRSSAIGGGERLACFHQPVTALPGLFQPGSNAGSLALGVGIRMTYKMARFLLCQLK